MKAINLFAQKYAEAVKNTMFPYFLEYGVHAERGVMQVDATTPGCGLEAEFTGLTTSQGNADPVADPVPVPFYLNIRFFKRVGKERTKAILPRIRAVPMQMSQCPDCGKVFRMMLGAWNYKLHEFGKVICGQVEDGKRCEAILAEMRDGKLRTHSACPGEVDPCLTGDMVEHVESIYKAAPEASTGSELPRLFAAVKAGSAPAWTPTDFEAGLRDKLRGVRHAKLPFGLDMCPLELTEQAGIQAYTYMVSLPPVSGWYTREQLGEQFSIGCWR